MLEVVRTVASLFRQMRAQGRPVEELELVRRAYDLSAEIFSGRFEIDGTSFQSHGIGTASVLSQLGAPAPVIGLGCLHNAYNLGDWGDGKGRGAYPRRRARVREVVGPEVEERLYEFFRRTRPTRSLSVDEAGSLEEPARWLALCDLAELFDKWDDGRIAYSAPGRSDRAFIEGSEGHVVELARRLGGDEFAGSFEAAFARMGEERIPESLKLGRVYSVVVPPASYRRRPLIAVRSPARRVARVVRRWARKGR